MDKSSPSPISPIVILLLCVISSAVVLAVYVTWCNAYRRARHAPSADVPEEGGEIAEFSTKRPVPPAVKYGEEEGMVSADQMTCAVCLSDFKDGETVRLLPECVHCFHARCIDMWLRSHTNCPMCRTETSLILNALHNTAAETAGGAADSGVRVPVIGNDRLSPTIAS